MHTRNELQGKQSSVIDFLVIVLCLIEFTVVWVLSGKLLDSWIPTASVQWLEIARDLLVGALVLAISIFATAQTWYGVRKFRQSRS